MHQIKISATDGTIVNINKSVHTCHKKQYIAKDRLNVMSIIILRQQVALSKLIKTGKRVLILFLQSCIIVYVNMTLSYLHRQTSEFHCFNKYKSYWFIIVLLMTIMQFPYYSCNVSL